jgi:hypothetical protein
MWDRLILISCASLLGSLIAFSAFAARTPATDLRYEANYSYATPGPLLLPLPDRISRPLHPCAAEF